MRITTETGPDLLLIIAEGLLDNESSRHFRTTVDEAVRNGHDRIRVNMQGVSFLSSAGISVLLDCRKQLESLQGHFGITDVNTAVKRILEQTRVYALLDWDRKTDIPRPAAPQPASTARQLEEPGLELEIYELDGESLTCRVIGQPGAAFGVTTSRTVPFPRSVFGLGLGAFGSDFEDCKSRFGDFVAVSGGVAQSPTEKLGAADYLLASGNFIPEVQMLYGLTCEGGFAQLVRFRTHSENGETPRPISLSRIAELCLSTCVYETAGIVLLGECVGMVGAVLRRSPAQESSTDSRFDFPQIRDWLSFSGEQLYRRSLALVAGIVRRGPTRSGPDPLGPLLRPLDTSGRLTGHFHAAAFPYRPLKKGRWDLNESVTTLFDSGTLQGVLHLLNDTRPIVGAGETEFLKGTCWIAPIQQVVQQTNER